MKNKLTGFTLIELLVVVLIIGILAAIAVPQYKIAVEKSRTVEALMITKTLAQAERVYYLANGTYSKNLALLDVDLPGISTILGVGNAITTQYFLCRSSSSSRAPLWKDALAVCERSTGDYAFAHTIDGSNYCVYYSDLGEQICKSIGKEKTPEVREDTYRL